MKIQRDGFITQTAYFFTPDDYIPARTNLCSLFWRFIGIGLSAVFIIIMFFVIDLVIHLSGFVFAVRGNILYSIAKGEGTGDCASPYTHWPRIGGRRVWPIGVIAAFGLGFWLPGYVSALPLIVNSTTNVVLVMSLLLEIAWITVAVAGICAIFLATICVKKAWRTETVSLFRAWAKAKKERVCPLVEIVG